MNKILTTALAATILFGATACNRPQLIDGKVVLDKMKSADIEGIESQMLSQAKDSMKAGNYQRAASTYAQLADRYKDKSDYRFQQAEANRKAGYLDAAIESYDKVIEKKPKHIKALEGKGLTMLSKGDFDSAGDSLAKVMTHDAKRWRTLNGLALLFVMKGEYSDALAYFTEALVNSANNISVLNNIGLTLMMQGHHEDAIEALETASALSQSKDLPLRRHVEMNLALVYGIKGDMELAKQMAGRHLQGAALNNNLGFYAYLSKDKVLARSYLNMALTGSTRHYERAWKNLETLEGNSGEEDKKTDVKAKTVKVK